ncbi:MAG: AAA family ATPase [Patescibacteria group bacterium]|nr:AAA family ATPase [Patescibacteria group bacterium]
MHIKKIIVHNFKSIEHQELTCGCYNVLVGENNSGKSNLISALRFFYGEYKLAQEDVYQKIKDDAIYVEIEYKLSDGDMQFFSEKGSKYILEGNRLVVRTESKVSDGDVSSPIRRGRLKDTNSLDEDNKFFGFSGVSKVLLGEIIYIPPIKELKDELKTTSQSATIMKLLKKISHPKIKKDSLLSNINQNVDALNKSDIFDELNGNLSDLMKGYGCNIKIEINQLSVESIISSASLHIIEENFDKMPPENKGTGLQRALLICLIKYWAEVSKDVEKIKNEPPTILLFEEPEIFQHPQKQAMLFGELKEISTNSTPVFLTTHSSHFVSEEDDDLSFVTRVYKESCATKFKQVSVATIAKSNSANRFKFWKYLDSEKNKIFFAQKVLLCEGNTEKLLCNYLIKTEILKDNLSKQSEYTVIDCNGKFNLPHFMRICNDLNIEYLIFYDLDSNNGNRSVHQLVNQEITDEKTGLCKQAIESSDDLDVRLFKKPTPNCDKNLILDRIINNEHDVRELDEIKNYVREFVN